MLGLLYFNFIINDMKYEYIKFIVIYKTRYFISQYNNILCDRN